MSINHRLRVLTAALLLGVAFTALQPLQPTYAQSVEVNSTADVVADDGQCTLREAITAANTNTASGTLAGECRAGSGTDVVYVPNGTYTLTSELMIGSNLWLIGQSEAGTIIQAAAAASTVNYRVITITGSNARLGRLTLRHGGCRFGCPFPGPNSGGLLLNQGNNNILIAVTATLGQTTVNGDAIYNSGQLTIFNSTISDSGNGFALTPGGGVYNTGQMVILNSTITNNNAGSANSYGGGIWSNGPMLQVINSTLSGNRGTFGAGIYIGGGSLVFWDSLVTNNPGSFAIFVEGSGNTSVRNSTIYNGPSGGQSAGIRFIFSGQADVINTTIVGHYYEGIFSDVGSTGRVEVMNSTIASNYIGLRRVAGIVNATNTIVANNSSADCIGTINSTGGHNIAGDATCVGFTQPTDQTSTNPMLNALADNGGPTQTMSLQPGSPAIDQGDNAICSLIVATAGVDQRGALRPAAPGICDIGAFEYGAASNEYPDAYTYNTNVAEDNTLNDVVPSFDPDGDPIGSFSPVDVRPANDQSFNLATDGSLTYTPLPDFNGYDAFIYQTGHSSDPPTINRYRESYSLVLIRVDPENDPPVNTVPATATVVVSMPTGIGGVSVDDPDVDENPGGQMQITLTATNGTVSVPGTSGATVTNNGTANVTITGTLAQVNAELAGIQFTGAAVGAATLQVLSSDLGNWGAPGVLTDTDIINITVTGTLPPAPGGGGGSGSGAASSGPVCTLTIDVKADKGVVSLGDPVKWTVEIRNPGPVDCHGLTLTGTMDDAFVIRDMIISQGTIIRDGLRFEIDLGSLSVDQMAEITIDSQLVGGAGFELPEGAAGQTAGTEYCLTGYVNNISDTGCVMLFPDNLPATGGQPVNWWGRYGLWIGLGMICLLVAGGWWVFDRQTAPPG